MGVEPTICATARGRRLFSRKRGRSPAALFSAVVEAPFRHPFVPLLIASVVLVRAPVAYASTAAALLFMAALGTLIAGIFWRLQQPLNWHWENERLADRISNIKRMLGLVRDSIVIVTGQLHHNLYGNADVVAALKRMPEGVFVVVLHERPLDPVSGAFIEELKRRECSFERIAPTAIQHGAVIDALHTKEEEFGVDDGALEKHVDYYLYNPKRARRFLDLARDAAARRMEDAECEAA